MPAEQVVLSKLYGRHADYIRFVDRILPKMLRHRYHFMDNARFGDLVESQAIDASAINYIFASELIDKAHLVSVTSLKRAKKWVEGTCIAYDKCNYLSWASAARGLIESAGDRLDALLPTALTLSDHYDYIYRALSRRATDALFAHQDLEAVLGHYILAKWMRAPKANVQKARENAQYVELLKKSAPSVIDFYRRLCGITHPSSSSFDYLFRIESDGLSLNMDCDREAIDTVLAEFPHVLPTAVELACNGSFATLRVLHRFKRHPQLTELKELDWSAIPG